MSKRFLFFLPFFITAITISGQSFDGWGGTHINVSSYDGTESPGALTLRIYYSGSYLYEPNWKLSVRVKDPFRSGNTYFPMEKFLLAPARTEGQASNPGPVPTIQQIGMPSPVALNNISEVFLVPSSNVPLENVSQWNSFYDLQLIFNLIVAGGGYLQNYHNKSYRGSLIFTAYRQDNTPIGSKEFSFTIQISKVTGTPPETAEYSISFTAEASTAQIEYKSMADYVNGTSVTYGKGLTVSATTDYQVTVRSVESNFNSPAGNTLPLDIVKLHLMGGPGDSLPVELSTSRRTVLQGQSTGGRAESYDVVYSTEPNDPRLMEVSSDQYSTQLMFEITPR